jgi:hypothetical protein
MRKGIIQYCKRPIKCLASSEILTSPTPSPPGECVIPPPVVREEDTLAGWRGGGGSIVRKTPATALYSIYVSTYFVEKWFVDTFSALSCTQLRTLLMHLIYALCSTQSNGFKFLLFINSALIFYCLYWYTSYNLILSETVSWWWALTHTTVFAQDHLS